MSKNQAVVLVKPAHKQETFTEKQILEIARCADPINGPQYFMSNFFYIQHPVKGKMLYQPFDYQKKLIDTYHNFRFSISLMPRQTGKCVKGDSTMINIRNNKTGEEREISIKDFYDMQANNAGNKSV